MRFGFLLSRMRARVDEALAAAIAVFDKEKGSDEEDQELLLGAVEEMQFVPGQVAKQKPF